MIVATKKIPIADGAPLIGSASSLLKDPVKFFIEQYHKQGPVYRVKTPATNFLILAGPTANRFMQKQGTDFFSTADAWQMFKKEFNTEKFILASDGEEHFEMRRIMKRGYSPAIIKDRVPEVIENIHALAKRQAVGKDILTVDFMQRLTTNQLGFFLANTFPEDYFTDLRYFIRNLINIMVYRKPAFTNKFPKYKRAKAKTFELARKVLEEHRNNPNKERVPDFIDDLLAANEGRTEPFFSENDLISAAIGPFIAGLDTVANTAAFQLYDLLKHPELMKQVRMEVDEAFEDGIPNMSKLRKIKSLHALALESLRMHPVAPAQKRIVKKTFEFEGYTIEKGETVFVFMVLTHFLPEFFPEPYKYDISRYAPPRNEHRQPSIYAPFGLGPHICSGNKMAEVLLMTIAGTLIHYLDFEPLPPNYKMILDTNPIPGPSQKFAFRIKNFRNVKH